MLDTGTISSCTLRTVDLLQALGEALEREARAAETKDDAELRTARYALILAEQMESGELDDDPTAEEQGADIINDLMDCLQGFAPPYCYVGALEGDGAEIGVWPDDEAIRMAIHDGDILALDHRETTDPENVSPAEYEAIYYVNDHGNATLYTWHAEPVAGCHWREAWAVV